MGQIKNIKLHIVTDIKCSTNQQLLGVISRHWDLLWLLLKLYTAYQKQTPKMKYSSCILAILPAFIILTHCETCTSPAVSTDTYTSKHIALSTETVYVAEFSVNCKEDVRGFNLYAEIEAGVLVPVALVPESYSYQISWIKDHKKAVTGSIPIKMFDDEGHTAYRKAQRNNGDVSEVAPLFTIQVNHPGVNREGLFVQTEFIAVVTALLVWWGSNTLRNQIME